jgi:hypothetical protein
MINDILTGCLVLLTLISIRLFIITEWNNRRKYLVDIAIRKANNCNEIFLQSVSQANKANLKITLTFENEISNNHLILWRPILTEIISSLNILTFNKRLFTWLLIRSEREMNIIRQIFWEELGTGIRKEIKKYSQQKHSHLIKDDELKNYLNIIEETFHLFPVTAGSFA